MADRFNNLNADAKSKVTPFFYNLGMMEDNSNYTKFQC